VVEIITLQEHMSICTCCSHSCHSH